MVPEIRYIHKKEKLRNAAIRILNEGIGSLIVMDEDNKPIGIITKRDIIRALIFEGQDPDTITVEEVMNKPLITVNADEPIETVLEIMYRHNISHLPVEEKGRLIGIISDYDIVELFKDMIDIFRNKLS